MTQTPGDVTGNESRGRTLAVQTIRDTGSASTTLPVGELTYAPLRLHGVADDLSVVVYSARAD